MQNMICRKTQNSKHKNHLLNFYLNSVFLNVKISIFINICNTFIKSKSFSRYKYSNSYVLCPIPCKKLT